MNEFQKARFTLTAWYITISALLLIIFSIAAISAEQTALNTILRVVSNRSTRPRLTALFDAKITDFEKNFQHRLFVFDVILLLSASGASYFLSGRTLKPIQEMVKQQEEFSADVSHELRTPLTTIGMEIEATKRTEKHMPKIYQETFASIYEEVARMKGIVEGLLPFVRGNSSESKSLWKTVNVSILAQHVFKQMEPLAASKHITFSFERGEDVALFGDQEQIKQVMLILLDNAIKYTPQQGTVRLTTAKENNQSVIIVQDNGEGISEKDIPHIFERFYRGIHTGHTIKGTGLGLSIAKKIMEKHKGKIFVTSKHGEGSLFTLQFPYHS